MALGDGDGPRVSRPAIAYRDLKPVHRARKLACRNDVAVADLGNRLVRRIVVEKAVTGDIVIEADDVGRTWG